MCSGQFGNDCSSRVADSSGQIEQSPGKHTTEVERSSFTLKVFHKYSHNTDVNKCVRFYSRLLRLSTFPFLPKRFRTSGNGCASCLWPTKVSKVNSHPREQPLQGSKLFPLVADPLCLLFPPLFEPHSASRSTPSRSLAALLSTNSSSMTLESMHGYFNACCVASACGVSALVGEVRIIDFLD